MIEKQFQENVKMIIDEGKRKGLKRKDICKAVKSSNAIFSRWKHKPPETIEILEKMHEYVRNYPEPNHDDKT